MKDNVDKKGVERYKVGIMKVMENEKGEKIVDEIGRR